MRRATPGDIPLLLELMTEFYAEGGFRLDAERAGRAFTELLADERLGYVWIIEAEQQAVGHVVITLRYAMEYAGTIACLDDLFVRPAWRNRGLSQQALLQIRSFCEAAGIRAMTVEVGIGNWPAQKVYRRIGFAEEADRQLLALGLAPPAHVL